MNRWAFQVDKLKRVRWVAGAISGFPTQLAVGELPHSALAASTTAIRDRTWHELCRSSR